MYAAVDSTKNDAQSHFEEYETEIVSVSTLLGLLALILLIGAMYGYVAVGRRIFSYQSVMSSSKAEATTVI